MRVNDAIAGLEPYDPKYMKADVLLSANENPSDLPDAVKSAAIEAISRVRFNRYPDPLAVELRKAISGKLRSLALPGEDVPEADRAAWDAIGPDGILLGNGGDELLFDMMLAFGGAGHKLLVCSPSFSVYGLDAQMTSTEVVDVPRRAGFSIDEDAVVERAGAGDVDIVAITSPNNPTGDCVSPGFVERLCASTDALVLVDEAYGEFSGMSCIPMVARHGNLCVLRTFSKAYSLAGVRLGYVVAGERVIGPLKAVRQPYSVDAVSQAIGLAVVQGCEAFVPVIRGIVSRRAELFRKLASITGVEAFPSKANFILVRARGAGGIWESMLGEGVLVRDFSRARGLEDCLRVTVGTSEENDRMLDALTMGVMRGFRAG